MNLLEERIRRTGKKVFSTVSQVTGSTSSSGSAAGGAEDQGKKGPKYVPMQRLILCMHLCLLCAPNCDVLSHSLSFRTACFFFFFRDHFGTHFHCPPLCFVESVPGAKVH